MLTDLHLNALTVLINLGVRQAVSNFRQMLREGIHLTIPKVQVVTRDSALADLSGGGSRIVAIHQAFDGAIAGRALLVFPELKSMELVRAVVGSDLPPGEIFHLEQEALAETGNVILNGCLTAIANGLERTLQISLPEVVYGEGDDVLGLAPPQRDDFVVFVYIRFTVMRTARSGSIAMLLELRSLDTLKELLNAAIDRAGKKSRETP